MQGSHLFEYAIIRIVPKVEREEFLNAGVILYCQQQKFLQVRFTLDDEKLSAFGDSLNIPELKEYLDSFERICKGGKDAGPIGELDIASRFRWLTALRSTVVQTSRVHPGLCDKAEDALEKLYTQLVL
ncbi:MAG: DUF3037 domain-containing protein [Chitinophagaceae bacterium]